MSRARGEDCTIGVDVGTTSVKAVAVDGQGAVVARARVPHRVGTPTVDCLEHDVDRAWRRGPRKAFAEVASALDGHPAGAVVTSMVPSITAVDQRGRPLTPGLLYGDTRARDDVPHGPDDFGGERVEGRRMLEWAIGERPDAAAYWPCQAVATHSLSGVPAVDTAASASFGGLFLGNRWDPAALHDLHVDESKLAVVVNLGEAAGTVPGTPTAVGGGSVDAFCEQIVAGANRPGDVLAIFGATLVCWVVADGWVEKPGLVSFPSTEPGQVLIGGASNAGALFADWARSLLGSSRRGRTKGDEAEDERSGDPERVPVWLPYLRGERTPFHDPLLRASVHGLDITQGPESLLRAAHEASGFVIRRIIERSGIQAQRVIAAGGGSRSVPWMQAVADATGLPVTAVAVSEGAALGASFMARLVAGLETDFSVSGTWARPGRRIDPDPAWAAAASSRFARFEEIGPGD